MNNVSPLRFFGSAPLFVSSQDPSLPPASHLCDTPIFALPHLVPLCHWLSQDPTTLSLYRTYSRWVSATRNT